VGFVLVALLYGAVLLVRRGTGMASDYTMVIVTPSVLVRSVQRACSCQSKCTKPYEK